MLIALSGKSLAGKSTAAEYLVSSHHFERVSFAHALKFKAMQDFSLSPSQVYDKDKDVVDPRYGVAPREILIAMGNLYRRFDKNYWVQRALANYKSGSNVVIDDCRFINEAAHVRSLGGVVIRLQRPGAGAVDSAAALDVSETEMDSYDFDKVITSTSVSDMQRQLTTVLPSLKNIGTVYTLGRGPGDLNVI